MKQNIIFGELQYLVMENRGEDRFFGGQDDYHYCIDQMVALGSAHQVHLYAWCLLPNRIHVLVGSEGPTNDVSRFMKALACRMAVRGGDVFCLSWKSDFYCCPVENSSWVLACMRYIESLPNGVGARFPDAPPESNSYCVRAGRTSPGVLDFPTQYCMLGRTDEERFCTYSRYLRNGCREKERRVIHGAVRESEPIGSDFFVRRWRKHYDSFTRPLYGEEK